MRWRHPNNSGRRRVVFPRRVKNGLFRAQKGRCAYCGYTHRTRYLVIDHKHPVSRGGGDEIDNLQLLCNSCNMRKGIQSDEEFRYRYQQLLAADSSIPSPPIPQNSFSEETQRTRAPREVRTIYHERFTAARERQGVGRGSGCGLLVAAVVLSLLPLMLLALILLRPNQTHSHITRDWRAGCGFAGGFGELRATSRLRPGASALLLADVRKRYAGVKACSRWPSRVGASSTSPRPSTTRESPVPRGSTG